MVIENERQILLSSGCDVQQFILDSAEALQRDSRVRSGLNGIWNVSVARSLDERIQEFKPDVVHVHTPFPLMSPVVFRVASRRSAAVVGTVHAFRYSCVQGQFFRDGHICELCLGKRLKLSGLRYRCYHDSLSASAALTAGLALHKGLGTFDHDVDAWIALSEFMKSKLTQEGFPSARVTVKPNSVPDPGVERGQRGDKALFLGRLERVKGVVTLLEAWKLMADPPRLVILGDGSLRELVERVASEHPQIEFRGWVAQAVVRKELASARFVIMPSEWYEGHPVAAIQAYAAGTPMIASDVGNFSEMIEPGVNGYLFRSGMAESLAAVVEAAWKDAGLMPKLERGARETYVERYSEEGSRDTLLSVYARALAERARRKRSRAGGRK